MKPSPPPETIGDRIAHERRRLAVRLHRDVTPADLAGLLEVNPATVYRWESGEKTPREDALERMAMLFDVEVAWLRYGLAGAAAGAPTMPLDSFTPMPRKEEREAAKKAKKRRA